MMSASLSRRLRRAGLSLVPARHRGQLRAWYEGLHFGRPRLTAAFEREAGLIRVTPSSGPSFVILPDCVWDVSVHFEHAEAAAELSSFLACSRAAGGTLLDVGANHALFSVLHCLANPRNRAVAYEPSAALCARIERIARLNGIDDRLQVVCRGLSDSGGAATLLHDAASGRMQLAPFAGTEQATWQASDVEMTTLDAEAAGRPGVTLVKIDVEGQEPEVLRGAAALLEDVRPVVLLELHLNYIEQRALDPVAVVSVLVKHRYHLFDVKGRAVCPADVARAWSGVMHLVARPVERLVPGGRA